MATRTVTRDSLERALIHHKMDYSPPGPSNSKWLLRTGIGTIEATSRQVEFYVIGLADAERRERRDKESS